MGFRGGRQASTTGIGHRNDALVNVEHYSRHRGLAVTKRGGWMEVNVVRLGISYKRACVRLLEIPALRQSAWAFVLS